eukprot:TRINITY_DN20674_c0_g4_i3.p4 TRINITY_DN20674_c0_g4~~TRINITY_DN20674_c0_g4_i3.p4  ORF type:complete len:101 (+),score=17.70 TRINITY_DN20674_c0_g4_i3:329-631(+)
MSGISSSMMKIFALVVVMSMLLIQVSGCSCGWRRSCACQPTTSSVSGGYLNFNKYSPHRFYAKNNGYSHQYARGPKLASSSSFVSLRANQVAAGGDAMAD